MVCIRAYYATILVISNCPQQPLRTVDFWWKSKAGDMDNSLCFVGETSDYLLLDTLFRYNKRKRKRNVIWTTTTKKHTTSNVTTTNTKKLNIKKKLDIITVDNLRFVIILYAIFAVYAILFGLFAWDGHCGMGWMAGKGVAARANGMATTIVRLSRWTLFKYAHRVRIETVCVCTFLAGCCVDRGWWYVVMNW